MEYNQLSENNSTRGSFMYTTPVLAPNSSIYGRTSSNSNVTHQQTQLPVNTFHLQSGDCYPSEAPPGPIVKTEASSSQQIQEFQYPLVRGGHQTMQHHQQGGVNGSSNEVDTIKAKIAAHPQYSNLLEAYMECQKIGAPPEVVARLTAVRRDFETQQRSTVTCRGASTDPELDQFMEAYYDMLVKYREELTRPLQEAMEFMRRIEAQLNTLSHGPVRIFSADKYEEVGSSEEEQENSGGEMELPDIDPRAEDRELKNHLLKKYSGYLSSLKQELSKKKKKGKLPKEARQKLLNWWELHYKWPYPSRRWLWQSQLV
uniref:ELK domain-containing protein n=1 Tax=Nelumbo nucifera TaxID=4432 RepID=A0A822ZDS8_NELNU|nr:TPA_asm: hypothetical protein HUJ06_015918 [Nelumbo nucifera]